MTGVLNAMDDGNLVLDLSKWKVIKLELEKSMAPITDSKAFFWKGKLGVPIRNTW